MLSWSAAYTLKAILDLAEHLIESAALTHLNVRRRVAERVLRVVSPARIGARPARSPAEVLVRTSFEASTHRYGSRIHEDLLEQQERISRKRVIRLTQDGGLKARARKRFTCTAVMESLFSTVTSELRDRFDSGGETKMELFRYIEVFYNQRRRHSTLASQPLLSAGRHSRLMPPAEPRRRFTRSTGDSA